MKSFRFLLLLVVVVVELIAAQAEVESEPLLRSRVQHREASRLLDSSWSALQHLAIDMKHDLQTNPVKERKTLLFRRRGGLDAYCNRVEEALDHEFTCGCRFLWIVLAYEFRCYAKDNQTTQIGEYEGRAKYQGLLDLNPFRVSVDLKAKVCIDQATYKGNEAQTLCVAGVFCAGLQGNFGICGCQAEYGNVACSCESCDGGISVGCQGFSLPLCVPLPVTA